MSRHALLALTISERLEQLEKDMTIVHDAVSRLAERLDLIEEAIVSRDKSHLDVVEAQINRADDLLAQLREEDDPGTKPAERPTAEARTPTAEPATEDFSTPLHY